MSTPNWIFNSIAVAVVCLGANAEVRSSDCQFENLTSHFSTVGVSFDDSDTTRYDIRRCHDAHGLRPAQPGSTRNISSESHRANESPVANTSYVDDSDRLTVTFTDDSRPVDSVDSEDIARIEREPSDSGRERLRSKLEMCLAQYYIKHVDTIQLRPWSIMHGILAFGQESKVVCHGLKVNAVEYLCHNGLGNDRQLMYLDGGRLRVRRGQGFQGHDGQLLAILAQSDVPSDQKIVVDGKTFTVQDLVELEKSNCRAGEELTFSLIGLSHYLDSDATWRSSDGQRWSIPRLIHEEITQPINGAACGGVHRLMGLSYAVRMRHRQGKPISGQWLRAANFIHEYHRYVMAMQNDDGSFSTDWFEARSEAPDPRRRMYTTGHILEWLAYSLPNDQLEKPQIMRAAEYLAELLLAEASPNHPLTGTDVGPKCHAVRALRIYEARLFGQPSDHQQLEHQSTARMASLPQVFEIQRQHGDRATVHSDDERPSIRPRARLFGRR